MFLITGTARSAFGGHVNRAHVDADNEVEHCTLKFAVTSLYLFMIALLHVTLKDSGSCGLVETGSLQDMCSIDPVVGLPPHDMLPFGVRAGELVLPDWVLSRREVSVRSKAR